MTATAVTESDLRHLLSDRRVFAELPDEVTLDSPLVFDSLGLTWFLHQLAELHGIEVDPDDPDLHNPTTVREILAYLERWQTDGA